jgi:hypothetical protein
MDPQKKLIRGGIDIKIDGERQLHSTKDMYLEFAKCLPDQFLGIWLHRFASAVAALHEGNDVSLTFSRPVLIAAQTSHSRT